MRFSEKVLKLTEQRGWTITSVMAKIGSFNSAYYRWENKGHKPTVENVKAICDLFGCDANWLINDGLDWEDSRGDLWDSHLLARVICRARQIGPQEALERMEVVPEKSAPPVVVPGPTAIIPGPKQPARNRKSN